MRIRLLFLVATVFAALFSVAADAAKPQKAPFRLISEGAGTPAINDKGEIVYYLNKGGDQAVYTTRRGLVATLVDANNLGISNTGEVVYDDASEATGYVYVTSTTRGRLLERPAYGATISPTTGEVSFQYQLAAADPVTTYATTLQGAVESFDRSIYSVGVGDVNDYGEVVFELRDLSVPYTRIYSIHRGYLTDIGVDARQPAINNRGETVYGGFDSAGRQQVFSTTRGQLTFFEDGVTHADQPDIDNKGRVVFRGTVNGVSGVFLYQPKGKQR